MLRLGSSIVRTKCRPFFCRESIQSLSSMQIMTGNNGKNYKNNSVCSLPISSLKFTHQKRQFSTNIFLLQAAESTTKTVKDSSVPNATPSVDSPAAKSAPESVSGSDSELVLNMIPDKPMPLGSDSVIPDGLAAIEPTLNSLGLASWWPPGRIQYFLEYLHVNFDVPWWATIVAATCAIRLIVFPLVVKSQKNAAVAMKHGPQMQHLQTQMTEARKRGDLYESAKLGQELQEFMKKNNYNPLKSTFPMFLQFPFFISMFMGLRGMAYLPVESLSTGGLSWFEDLTVSDPYYVLPLLTSATLYLNFYLSADGVGFNQAGPIMKGVMKGMPVALFFLTMNFPSGITFYWFVTNCITVVQVKLIRSNMVRKKLGIPEFKKPVHDKIPAKEKTFRQGVKDAIDNWKVQADIIDRRSFDEQVFREAGTGKVKRTYKFDPLKPIVKKS